MLNPSGLPKKPLVAGIASVIIASSLLIGGCATSNSGDTTSASDTNSAVEDSTLTTRTVTFPKIYFQNEDADKVTSELENAGCTDITANEDGSYTVTMSIDRYNQLVDTTHDKVAEQIDAMPGSESYPNVTSITYDDQYANITMNLSVTTLGYQDMFDAYGPGLVACMYQQIAGQPVACNVTLLDPDGNSLGSVTLPTSTDEAATTTE
ncbi:MAG: hypothetical protein LKI25_08560 [Atopobiaceae bacterium]|jgi:hypothetical protein|nr:hypothetical protein [Atopobiaceae bacterium]MCI2174238.1 hypothetical protein [Atopobiaceae bacterium]MCI2206879.1 hypothetical protein [Atopobiaceae bacterium]